jgi:hypothetical protein
MNETNFSDLFITTGGTLILGALVCLFAGTIGLGGLIAAVIAAYGVLKICNSMDRATQRARR